MLSLQAAYVLNISLSFHVCMGALWRMSAQTSNFLHVHDHTSLKFHKVVLVGIFEALGDYGVMLVAYMAFD